MWGLGLTINPEHNSISGTGWAKPIIHLSIAHYKIYLAEICSPHSFETSKLSPESFILYYKITSDVCTIAISKNVTTLAGEDPHSGVSEMHSELLPA